MFRFLRIVALLPVLFFTSNLMAAGYTCLADGVNVEYTSCDSGYYLNSGKTACLACNTVSNTSVLQTQSIANGTLTQTCSGKYTGGGGGSTIGSSACTGCSATTWSCSCDSGYVAKGSGLNCACVKSSGFVCDEEKQYDSCSAGYYLATLSGGVWVYNGTPTPGNACIACPAGKSCAGGTAAPVDCTAGTYSTGGAASCTACAAGSYSGVGAAQCTLCAAGTYQPSTGQASCLTCDSGKYTGNVYGEYATGATSCTPCPSGNDYRTASIPDSLYVYQMDANGNSSVYSSDVSIKSMTIPTWYQPGSIKACRAVYHVNNVAGNVRVEGNPYNVDTGKYEIVGVPYYGLSDSTFNAGFYVRGRYLDTYCDTTTNMQLYKTAYVCPAGSYCPGLTGLGGLRSCSATGADAYLNNETFGLIPCAAGSYQPNIGQSSCILAEPGYYVGTTGQTKQTTCGNVSRTEYGKTLSVPTYSDAAGAAACTACPQPTKYASKVNNYSYWSSNGLRDSIKGCHIYFGADFPVDNGETTSNTAHCFWDMNGDYGVTSGAGGSGCGVALRYVSCDAGYYSTTNTSATQYYAGNYTALVANVCGKNGADTGVYSPDGDPYGYTCPSVPDDFSQYSQYYVGVRGGDECTYEYDNVPFTNGSGKISDVTCMWEDISAITDPDMSPGELYCAANISGLAPNNLKCSAGYYYANTDEEMDWDWDGVYLDDIANLVGWSSSGAPCQPVGMGYASAADVLTRTACSTVRATVDPDEYGTGITSVPTYSDTTTAASCTACPAAQSGLDVKTYGYWADGGLHKAKDRCNVYLNAMDIDNGNIDASGVYTYANETTGEYGTGGNVWYAVQEKLHCDDQYYSTAAGTYQQVFSSLDALVAGACVAVTTPGKYSPAGDISLIDCPTGENTNISQKYAAKREWVNENFFGTNRCAHTYGTVGSTTASPYVKMTNLRCTLSADYTHYVCGADSVTKSGGRWNNNLFENGYSDYEMDEEHVCFGNGWGKYSDGKWGRYCTDRYSDGGECDSYDEEVYCSDAWNGEIYEHPYDGSELGECADMCGDMGADCDASEYISGEYCGGADGTLYAAIENYYCSDGDYYYCGDYYDDEAGEYSFEECNEYCTDDDYGTGYDCSYEVYVEGEGSTCDDLACPDYYNSETGKYMFGDYELTDCYEEDAYWVPMPAGLIPEWYIWGVDTLQAETETTPGYYSNLYSFDRVQCSGSSSNYSGYQDEYGASSCKYCQNLAGGLFPSGSASHAGNTSLMDTPYDCYGNGTGAYSSSCSSCYGGCTGGYYLTYADESDPETAYCEDVGAGNWSAGGQTVYYGDSGSYNSCPAGETTVGYGIGANEAGDCGKKMHVGNSEMYLRSTKATTPSLNVLRDGKTYYANMSPVWDFKVSKDAEQSFRAEYNDKEYWIYDQSAQPVLPYGKLSYRYPSYSPTSSYYNTYGGYDNATGVWKIVPNSSAASAGYPTITGQAAYHSATYTSSALGKLGSSISADFEPNNTKSGSYASIWCKATSPAGNGEWVLVEYNKYCGSYTNCEAAYECARLYYRSSGSYWNAEKAFMETMGFVVQ